MKTKKSKIKKIILIVIISIVVLVTLIGTIGLRLVIRHYAKEVIPDLGPAAEYFTEYDQTMIAVDAVQEISHNGMTITIPAHFKEKEISLEGTYMYAVMDEEGTASESIVFMRPDDVSNMSLFSEENIAEIEDSFLEKYAVKKLMQGFEDLGHGIPDNAYTTLKSTALLTADDYSFWNWQQGFAFVVSGMLKNTSFSGNYNYIYETEDICGIIHVTDLAKNNPDSDCNYYLVLDMYSTADFSTSHGLLIKCNSLEMAYAMINSIVIE